MALQAQTGISSTAAQYFSSNYQALLQSSAVAPSNFVAPGMPADYGTNKYYYLSLNNGRYDLREQAKTRDDSGNVRAFSPSQASDIQVDAAVAYSISTGGVSPTDWLMARIADEFRLKQTAADFGPLLSKSPEPEMNIDFSNLSAADLTRMLNILVGRGRQVQSDSKEQNAKASQSDRINLLGMTAANLHNAIELQSGFNSNLTIGSSSLKADVGSLLTGDRSAYVDNIASAAIEGIVAGKTSDLEAARLLFSQSPAASVSSTKLNNLAKVVTRGLDTNLQRAADIVLTLNPDISAFGSDLDYNQTQNGMVVKKAETMGREAQIAYVKEQLKQTLADPALKNNLVDAMAADADALGTADLPLDQQYALYNAVADAAISTMAADDAYIEQLAMQAVQFNASISQLISNELTAVSQRDSVEQNV
jgi:hypothetical protein